MKKARMIQQFREHLTRLGYSKSSVQMLPACVGEFLHFQGYKPPAMVTPQDIMRYYAYLQERPNRRRKGGLSERFIAHHLYSLKLFFGWQLHTGQISGDPTSSLAFPTPQSRPLEVLTTAEVATLYAACGTFKERALLSLFYGCGLRKSEGAHLDMGDIHFRSGVVYVREGKGGKRREVPLSARVNKDLQDYVLNERYSQPNESAFLCNCHGRRASGNSMNRLLKKVLNRAGITKPISLHNLRHSVATHLLANGMAVEQVRDFLGHKHLESTQLYTRINPRQLHQL
ncbi:MAG: tyrosine-type recombinase/integrase [Cytophagales bacterium]|nr:tyrosine-type recombinase/integrase [Cytophagales bacterium]